MARRPARRHLPLTTWQRIRFPTPGADLAADHVIGPAALHAPPNPHG